MVPIAGLNERIDEVKRCHGTFGGHGGGRADVGHRVRRSPNPAQSCNLLNRLKRGTSSLRVLLG